MKLIDKAYREFTKLCEEKCISHQTECALVKCICGENDTENIEIIHTLTEIIKSSETEDEMIKTAGLINVKRISPEKKAANNRLVTKELKWFYKYAENIPYIQENDVQFITELLFERFNNIYVKTDVIKGIKYFKVVTSKRHNEIFLVQIR